MKEPTRWRDGGPKVAGALLRHAPAIRELTPEDRARTRARVAAISAVGGFALVQSAAIGAGLAVATVLAYAVVPAWIAPAPPSAPSSRAEPSLSTQLAPLASAAPPALSATIASATPPVSTDPAPYRLSPRPREARALPDEALLTPPPAQEPDSLALEAALLEQARAELAANPAEALRRAAEHAARYPAGKLAIERELVAIDALGRLGRSSEARARGEALLARTKGGLYETQLRQLLDGLR